MSPPFCGLGAAVKRRRLTVGAVTSSSGPGGARSRC